MSRRERTRRAFTLVPLLAVSLGCPAWGQEATEAPGRQPDTAEPPAMDLRACILTALRNSPQLVLAAVSVDSARSSVDLARSGYYPQVTGDAAVAVGQTGTTQGTGTPTTTNRVTNGVGIGLDWTLYETGRLEGTAESRAGLEAALLDRLDVLQTLVQQVADDYYAYLASLELLAVAERGVEAATQHVNDVQKRIVIGKAAEVEIYAVNEDLALAELDLIDAKSGIQTSLAQLRNTMALDHTAPIRIATEPPKGENSDLPGATAPDPEQTLPSLDQAVADALARRPDLRAGDATIKARAYALKRADRARGPQFSVGSTASYDYAIGAGGSPRWQLQAGMSWPLFDGRAGEATEDRAEAGLRQAKASRRQLELQISLEVEQALIELERTSERVRTGERSVAAADARLRTARSRYANGVGILLEVTDARASDTSAAADLVRARFGRDVARVAYQRATGTLPIPSVAEALGGGAR